MLPLTTMCFQSLFVPEFVMRFLPGISVNEAAVEWRRLNLCTYGGNGNARAGT